MRVPFRALAAITLMAGLAATSAHAQTTTPEWQSTLSSDGSTAVSVYSSSPYVQRTTFGMFCSADKSAPIKGSYFFLVSGSAEACVGQGANQYGIDFATIKFGERFAELVMRCRNLPESNSTWFWTDTLDSDNADQIVEFEKRFAGFNGDDFRVELFEAKAKGEFSHVGRQVYLKFKSECYKKPN